MYKFITQMDRCIIFFLPTEDGTKCFRVKDLEIEDVYQFRQYKDIVVKQIEGSKKVCYCLHCIIKRESEYINQDYAIFSEYQVVFTKKQKLFQFDSALDFFTKYIQTSDFKLKSIKYLTVYQKLL